MNIEAIENNQSQEDYLKELLKKLSNPVHKSLIQAYQGDNPVRSMESELGNILLEVLYRED